MPGGRGERKALSGGTNSRMTQSRHFYYHRQAFPPRVSYFLNYAPCISLLGSAPPLLLYSFQRGPFPSLSFQPSAPPLPLRFVPLASYLFRLQVVKWPGLVSNLPLCSRGVIKKPGPLLLLLLLLLPSLLVNRCWEFHGLVNRGCPLLSHPPLPLDFPRVFRHWRGREK